MTNTPLACIPGAGGRTLGLPARRQYGTRATECVGNVTAGRSEHARQPLPAGLGPLLPRRRRGATAGPFRDDRRERLRPRLAAMAAAPDRGRARTRARTDERG